MYVRYCLLYKARASADPPCSSYGQVISSLRAGAQLPPSSIPLDAVWLVTSPGKPQGVWVSYDEMGRRRRSRGKGRKGKERRRWSERGMGRRRMRGKKSEKRR